MTDDIDSPMEAEFDTVAEWTARVAADLGPEYYIPAACRGSGQPEVLDWLLERLGPRPGEVMIDVGAGMGGPAAYAACRTGVQPILAEPEPDACRAAARLFRAPVLQADATALPCGDGTADLAWCLGVLCTAPGRRTQRAMLSQLRRVLRPGGRIGLLVFLAVADQLDDPPQGNHFPSSGQLHDLFGQAAWRRWTWPTSATSPGRRRTGRPGSRPWSANCTAGTGTRRSSRRPTSRAAGSAAC